MKLLGEICDEIGRNGFKKILLFSSHGGNRSWLEFFLQSVTSAKKDYEVFYVYNKLVMPKDILNVLSERGRDYFPKLTDSDIAVLEDYVKQKKHDGHAGFGESAMLMGTYPELIHLDRCEAESGMSTHRADFLTAAEVQWGRSWRKNFPNSYSGHPPIGLTQEIADATVEIAVERAAKVLKMLKDDSLMDKVIY